MIRRDSRNSPTRILAYSPPKGSPIRSASAASARGIGLKSLLPDSPPTNHGAWPASGERSLFRDSLPRRPGRRSRETLKAALEGSACVEVEDHELHEGVHALHERAHEQGLFGACFEGMLRLDDADPVHRRAVQCTPKRAPKSTPVDKAVGRSCVFCSPAIDAEPKLGVTDYFLTATPFPYVAADGMHTLISARGHAPQHFSPVLLRRMIDMQAALQEPAPAATSSEAPETRAFTLLYNGIAGNSQPHLHWHAIRETLPLQRALDSGDIPLEPTEDRHVVTYDHGLYAGFLVRGTRSEVVESAHKIVERLEVHPLTTLMGSDGARRATYNLILLAPVNDQARLLVLPRRAKALKHDMGEFGFHSFGAFELGGVLDVKDEKPRPGYVAATAKHVRETLVPPSELDEAVKAVE